MPKRRCDKCEYYFAEYHEYKGHCRRCPPKNLLFKTEIDGFEEEYYHGDFPDVNADWWCGEFTPKRENKVFSKEEEKYFKECDEHVQKYGR